MDSKAWQATVPGVAKNQTQLKQLNKAHLGWMLECTDKRRNTDHEVCTALTILWKVYLVY